MTSVTTSLLRLYEVAIALIIGAVLQDGSVQAQRATYDSEAGDEKVPSHKGFNMLRGKRWRYPEGSNTVFWWEQPTPLDQAVVDNLLAKRGFDNLRHITYHDKVAGGAAFSYSHGMTDQPERFRAKSKSRQLVAA